MKTNRYPVLRVVAVIYKVIGVILAILTLIGACSMPFIGNSVIRSAGLGEMRGMGFFGGLVSGLLILLYGGFGALFLYAAGEIFTLLIDLEANTRATAELLGRSQNNV